MSAAGCQTPKTPPSAPLTSINVDTPSTIANREFLQRAKYDPWKLEIGTPDTKPTIAYIADGRTACLVDGNGNVIRKYVAGHYVNNFLTPTVGSQPDANPASNDVYSATSAPQELDLRAGTLTTHKGGQAIVFSDPDLKARDWPKLWSTSDIAIDGDPEAQQMVHANLFYLLSSTCSGNQHSIPPMGLSTSIYGGHIFWDADTWMFPTLIVQHPEDARSIVDYRFKTLAQAKKNAQAHGFPGAEYAWESALTGEETAPAEFAKERHITADIAMAAWQYYVWTGDVTYLKTEGWPILQASAQYWAKRATKGADGAYHITQVLPPDETAGPVDDDAYTNGVVGKSLQAAVTAAKIVAATADPAWSTIASKLVIPVDKNLGFPAEHAGMKPTLKAKQADTLLLLYPLNATYDASTQAKMLDFYRLHTIATGPAMTSCINAVISARLGRAQQSLDDFHDAYRPFERGPWDAFSEKRTTSNVYFMTGMAGALQSVLYGFAGLQAVPAGEKGTGHKIAGDATVSLYSDPHLPPGWTRLEVQGIKFRGKTIDLTIGAGNTVTTK